MAEQTGPVRRKVALKILKPGMDSRQVVARFEGERQALAMMDHPNIAKVHDGGTTESGRPYFVMELVRGLPITDYCDQEQLSIRERLDLFVLVSVVPRLVDRRTVEIDGRKVPPNNDFWTQSHHRREPCVPTIIRSTVGRSIVPPPPTSKPTSSSRTTNARPRPMSSGRSCWPPPPASPRSPTPANDSSTVPPTRPLARHCWPHSPTTPRSNGNSTRLSPATSPRPFANASRISPSTSP